MSEEAGYTTGAVYSNFRGKDEPARLLVRVVLRESAPADTPARVSRALAHELGDAGAIPPPIDVTVVPEIERDPGHGAKFKLVQSPARA